MVKKIGVHKVWILNGIWNAEAQPFEIQTNDSHFVVILSLDKIVWILNLHTVGIWILNLEYQMFWSFVFKWSVEVPCTRQTIQILDHYIWRRDGIWIPNHSDPQRLTFQRLPEKSSDEYLKIKIQGPSDFLGPKKFYINVIQYWRLYYQSVLYGSKPCLRPVARKGKIWARFKNLLRKSFNSLTGLKTILRLSVQRLI